jgi:MFS family permease
LAEGRKHEVFYGYILVAAAFFIMVVMWGALYSFGVFFKPVLAEFGWSSVAISGAYSLCFLLLGLSSMVTGKITDRFGPRIVVIVCGLFFGLGYSLMSQINAIWQFYLFYGVLVSIGISGSYVPLVSTAARWFVRRRGMMIGVVASGVGIGTVIIPTLATQLILNYGWRRSYIIVGMITLVLVIVAAQFLRRDPSQVGQLPYGAAEAKVANLSLETSGLSFEQAIRTRQLWLLWVTFLFAGFCIQSILVHIIPHTIELGISAPVAATVLAAIGGFNTAGRVIMGTAADRIGSKPALVISTSVISASFFWLLVAKELWMFYPFAVIFGISYGGFLALLSPVAAEIFGLRSAGILLGFLHFGMAIGEAAGPVLSGRVFDVTGSYHLAFLVSGIIAAIGVILTLMVTPAVSEGGGK